MLPEYAVQTSVLTPANQPADASSLALQCERDVLADQPCAFDDEDRHADAGVIGDSAMSK
jgi:hypothetical protein